MTRYFLIIFLALLAVALFGFAGGVKSAANWPIYLEKRVEVPVYVEKPVEVPVYYPVEKRVEVPGPVRIVHGKPRIVRVPRQCPSVADALNEYERLR
jgi:hypothetical protein